MTLELRELNKSFGSHHVLEGINLEIRDSHSLALIGPSGGGKSTLLRVVAGLERPDSGSVTLDGSPLPRSEEALRIYRAGLGIVFQAFNLFPHLTALENITLPLEKVHGRSREVATEQAQSLLDRWGLGNHGHKRPAQLSGGQRQRVAIARAVAVKPRLLLFDEPTSALDPEMTAEVLDTIEELRAEGRDLIIVTHQMSFARRVAQHVAFLSAGRIVEHGPSTQLFDAPESVGLRDFLGRIMRY